MHSKDKEHFCPTENNHKFIIQNLIYEKKYKNENFEV